MMAAMGRGGPGGAGGAGGNPMAGLMQSMGPMMAAMGRGRGGPGGPPPGGGNPMDALSQMMSSAQQQPAPACGGPHDLRLSSVDWLGRYGRRRWGRRRPDGRHPWQRDEVDGPDDRPLPCHNFNCRWFATRWFVRAHSTPLWPQNQLKKAQGGGGSPRSVHSLPPEQALQPDHSRPVLRELTRRLHCAGRARQPHRGRSRMSHRRCQPQWPPHSTLRTARFCSCCFHRRRILRVGARLSWQRLWRPVTAPHAPMYLARSMACLRERVGLSAWPWRQDWPARTRRQAAWPRGCQPTCPPVRAGLLRGCSRIRWVCLCCAWFHDCVPWFHAGPLNVGWLSNQAPS